MEFRQVVQSVCRTAAATAAAASPSTTSAAWPALASATRPVLSSFLPHSRPFTTNSKQQHEAAAVAARPQQSMPHPPLIGQFRQGQAAASKANILPPRPAPAKGGLLTFRAAVPKAGSRFPSPSGANTATASWAKPTRSQLLKGSVSGTGSSATDSLLGMPARIAADMQRATGHNMVTWDAAKFTDESYGSEPELRLRPSTGRTVEVRGNVDFARSLRLLQSITAVNNLRNDVRLQRFHERPALKRKRKLRERWRARFRDGFAATKRRVFELKAQGW
ncbi:hypothetical protein C8A05DRAFT_18791 [Staphylotrichum tortipilum]|uniref:Ribosomal protein S21 n=1 Tax=Staphylotrichum tortipilum TaxID=2831512 RepID=A0AAN6RQ36_9PEZI|nr:hypothetical protein C8A05DRAFT_18791 [Staphylotrichum longicolle]